MAPGMPASEAIAARLPTTPPAPPPRPFTLSEKTTASRPAPRRPAVVQSALCASVGATQAVGRPAARAWTSPIAASAGNIRGPKASAW